MTTFERIYRVLLKAYPVSYRREYEDPMVQHFRDQLRVAIGARTLLRFWLGIVTDLARTAPVRHLERWLPCHVHGHTRLSDEARQAVFFARYEASSFARSEISIEHLLLGLLRNEAVLRSTLGPSGIGDVVRRIEAIEAVPRRIPAREDLSLSQECKLAIKFATEEAMTPVEGRVSCRHLLRAILKLESTLAAQILHGHGVDSSRF